MNRKKVGLGVLLISLGAIAAIGVDFFTSKRSNKFKQTAAAYLGIETVKTEPASTRHVEMAKTLLKGGYILHFRHAERDKWIDVQMYDALESDIHGNGENSTRFAENGYFEAAVCLNERGKIQARAMGEHIKHIGLPVGFKISSPSCRSRQTADIAFEGYDRIDRTLVHRGPYNEKFSDHISSLRELYNGLPLEGGTNTVVSSHNSVVHRSMFDEVAPGLEFPLRLEEGGFYVIKRQNGKLILAHEFDHFREFQRVFFER